MLFTQAGGSAVARLVQEMYFDNYQSCQTKTWFKAIQGSVKRMILYVTDLKMNTNMIYRQVDRYMKNFKNLIWCKLFKCYYFSNFVQTGKKNSSVCV